MSAEYMVFRHILSIAEPQFARAAKRREELRGAKDVRAYAQWIRSRLRTLLGIPSESPTPLRARTTRVLQRDGYQVESVVFESRPSFFITANLYLPLDVPRPVAALLHPLGHTWEAKSAEVYQRTSITLVRNGFAVLSYDPIGQGERSQYWDSLRRCSSIVDHPRNTAVAEHEYAGMQSLLTGISMGGLMVWDGMRALDYLESRPEVDSNRIGCLGVSGGGVLTSYLMVLDDRIKAAAPVCYITTRKHWLERYEYADAEQVQDDVIKEGLDHSELCIAAAPKPVLIGTTTEDFFPMEGALESAARAKRAYGLLGIEERIETCVAEGRHGYKPEHRVAVSNWFRRWLNGESDPQSRDWGADAPLEAPDALWACPGGQTVNIGGRTVFDFTRERAVRLQSERKILFQDPTERGTKQTQASLRERLRDLLRIEPHLDARDFERLDSFERPESSNPGEPNAPGDRGTRGVRVSFVSEPGITVYGTLIEPAGEAEKYVICVEDPSAPGVDILPDELAAGPATGILSLEPRGTITTQAAPCKMAVPYYRMGVEGYFFYNYGMVGRSLLGCRVMDIVVGFLSLKQRLKPGIPIYLYGRGPGAIAALMATALEPSIAGAYLEQMLLSYTDLATTEFYDHPPGVLLSGVLQHCDLPEIAACVAPRPLEIVDPVDARRRIAFPHAAERAYALTREVYARLGSSAFRIRSSTSTPTQVSYGGRTAL